FKYSLHILKNKMVIFGSAANVENLFTANTAKLHNFAAIYNDPISITAYTQMAISIREKSNKVFRDIKKDKLLKTITGIGNDKLNTHIHYNNNTSIYYFNHYPDFTLMSYELFTEIVKQSYDSISQQEELINYYNQKKRIFKEQIKHGKVIHFYPSSLLITLATEDEFLLGLDDCIINPKLFLTNNQIKKFYFDIIYLLKTEPNFHICLNSNAFISSLSSTHGCILQNNLLFLFANKNIRRYFFSTNPTLLE
ncbi:hypothetical protein, partial [Anaerosporobacter sp.]